MLSNLGNFFQVASAVLVITSLAGLGLMRGTVGNLRESLKDLREEVGDKDRQIVSLQAARVIDKAEILRQSGDLDSLKRNLTGEKHWVGIGQKLDEHHREALTHWAADEELLGRILQALASGKKP